jgi:hypothetical protein
MSKLSETESLSSPLDPAMIVAPEEFKDIREEVISTEDDVLGLLDRNVRSNNQALRPFR